MRRGAVFVAQRLLRHEPRTRDGLRLAAATFRLWGRSRVGRTGGAITVEVTAPNGSKVALKLWTYVDVLVVREVFVDGDYRLPRDLSPAQILDIGANTGVSVRFLRAMFPEAGITAVEPDPANFKRLQENADDARLVQAAVAVEPGLGTFYVADEGWGSSLRERHDARPVAVEILTVADLVADTGGSTVGLLKVDIEGGEWPLLEAGALQDAADCIVGELHFGDGRSLEDAVRLFDGWQFDVHEKRRAIATFTARRAERPPHKR
jgi:FkbM family methyltransferase